MAVILKLYFREFITFICIFPVYTMIESLTNRSRLILGNAITENIAVSLTPFSKNNKNINKYKRLKKLSLSPDE